MSAIPLPYIGPPGGSQAPLGHYAVTQKSGATVSIGAGGILGSVRWAPTLSSALFVLLRFKAGWTVTGAVTAATPMDLQLIFARGFTVDFTTASTAFNMAAPAGTNCMNSGTMNNSLLGTNGPRIATTTVMSGQTATADAGGFASAVWVTQPSGNATVTQAVGTSGETKTVYEWTALAAHPPVLRNQEGILVETFTAGPTTGTVAYEFTWEWAEVFLF